MALKHQSDRWNDRGWTVPLLCVAGLAGWDNIVWGVTTTTGDSYHMILRELAGLLAAVGAPEGIRFLNRLPLLDSQCCGKAADQSFTPRIRDHHLSWIRLAPFVATLLLKSLLFVGEFAVSFSPVGAPRLHLFWRSPLLLSARLLGLLFRSEGSPFSVSDRPSCSAVFLGITRLPLICSRQALSKMGLVVPSSIAAATHASGNVFGVATGALEHGAR